MLRYLHTAVVSLLPFVQIKWHVISEAAGLSDGKSIQVRVVCVSVQLDKHVGRVVAAGLTW